MPTRLARTLVGALVVTLAACGGGGEEPLPGATALLDDEGLALPAARTDHETGAPVVTARQAAGLEDALGHDAVRVEVAAEALRDGADAVTQAVQIVYGAQAAHDLPADAPVLVHGDDLDRVRAAVRQLDAAGFSRVWIVEPDV